ncbi:MAG: polysaccharide deacetylase family protein [Deltaproteobacteria bacterium]|nr:polysaccharide deacetylase family protein [Deltaproteobacteria bacterium]
MDSKKPVRRALRGLKTIFYEMFYSKRLRLCNTGPIYTFTFDDVPVSAIINGARILDEHDAKGTFYLSSGMTGVNEAAPSEARTRTENLLRGLVKNGHQIGCHTYSHRHLPDITADEILADCRKNKLLLSNLLDGTPIGHFAYPYGDVSLTAKKTLFNEYITLRGTRPGINHDKVDVKLLRAVDLYSSSFDKTKLAGWIKENARLNGWLIFYTHGVEDEHDKWGTTPADLRWVIQECKNAEGSILNVADAYEDICSQKDKGL